MGVHFTSPLTYPLQGSLNAKFMLYKLFLTDQEALPKHLLRLTTLARQSNLTFNGGRWGGRELPGLLFIKILLLWAVALLGFYGEVGGWALGVGTILGLRHRRDSSHFRPKSSHSPSYAIIHDIYLRGTKRGIIGKEQHSQTKQI